MTATHSKSKAIAAWVAIAGGAFGLHRFYLHGLRDLGGWLYPLPSLAGLYGVHRMQSLGQDDRLAWVLIPWLGLALSSAMLAALVHALTSDDKWNARYNPRGPASRSGWLTVIGAIVALMLGAGFLIATIAFSAQRFYEFQADRAANTADDQTNRLRLTQ